MIILNRTNCFNRFGEPVNNIRTMKIVPDLRVFEVANVSRERGRKRIQELAALGVIEPKRTPTGRCLLSFEDTERLVLEL